MALSSNDIEQVVETIIHGSEEKLVSELTETIVREFAEGLTYSAEVDLFTLSRSFPAKASVILLKYRDRISEEVQSEIEDALNAAAGEDLANLAKIYGTVAAAEGASSHFAQVSKQTAIGVSQIIERQNVALSQSLQDTWYKISAEAVTAVNQGLKPREKVLADDVVKLMDAGIDVIPYHKGGKPTVTNHVDVALRRHITTQVSQAGGRMSLEAMDLYNHDLVITDAHYGARESHAYWQGLPCCRSGQKTIDGVTYPDMVSLTEYGSVTGLKGANCRHMIFPYFPGITKLPDREFKEHQEKFGMTSDEYYAATQRQRELERRVRKTKREIAGLEQAGLGFENPTYVNKRLLLGSQQKTLNTFCKENKLVRLYEREKAYGVAKQPRALRSRSVAKAKTLSGSVAITQNDIDSLLNNELAGVKFSAHPTYSPRLGTYGKTTVIVDQDGKIRVSKMLIGKQKNSSKRELIDTLIHEELEARILLNRHSRELFYELKYADDDERHAWIQKIINRYIKLKGF